LLRYALQKFACAHYLHVGEHFQAAGHCIWIAQTGLVFRESGSSPTRSTSG
jgi:hypothetical protein